MIKRKIGLIVNPISGMGGSVGLKGTDGEIYKKAIDLGAKPITPKRVKVLISHIESKDSILFIAAPGKMGADILKDTEFNFKTIGEIDEITTADDTKRIAKQMLDSQIELLIFCGGDGTARDIYDAVRLKIPVIAVPSGVKMFSSAFTLNPKAAAEMIEQFIEGSEFEEKEVLDIDEQAFREGKLKSKLYGYLKVPRVEKLLQGGKSTKIGKSVEENKNEIAKYMIENIKENVIYFLGPGTTVKAISDILDIPKALLGIDAIYNKTLAAKDINEEQILNLIKKYKLAEIIVSPIGGQGFIFGRGNKQFTPEVLKKIGKDRIHVVATEDKMKELMCLRVDTGEIQVDNMLMGHKKVIIGYNEFLLIEIR
jgi:predicted polyphosphate/ATP-dependent NAD kinase